ncbi:hypothetical protein ILUMI_14791 [Ignelater luminosus]|uniref:Reverse transcriptase domain-containing protein n=1 Tax=Ignelater luminosus TaxID=2038154 RepID=A0A8K0CVX5_IGNLU|nr:hypothetical protein ILUMI_14791 [Ignelater luminosus]
MARTPLRSLKKEVMNAILSFPNGSASGTDGLQKRILSQVGAQQGDPAGLFLFCPVIQAVIENLNSELNIFYLDDGTLGGDTNTVLQDLDTIIKSRWNLGLQINPSKCKLYFCSTYKIDVHEIKVLQDDIALLGAPLNVQSTAKVLNQKHDEMRLLFSRLKFLQTQHGLLLKSSMSLSFESISNISFDEQQWCIASLPIKFGGLGLRKASDIMLPAFLASINSVLRLITLMLQNITAETCIAFYPEALMEWQSVHGSSFPPVVSTQRNWDEINIASLLNSLQFSSVKIQSVTNKGIQCMVK